jgi:hypothetical protein
VFTSTVPSAGSRLPLIARVCGSVSPRWWPCSVATVVAEQRLTAWLRSARPQRRSTLASSPSPGGARSFRGSLRADARLDVIPVGTRDVGVRVRRCGDPRPAAAGRADTSARGGGGLLAGSPGCALPGRRRDRFDHRIWDGRNGDRVLRCLETQRSDSCAINLRSWRPQSRDVTVAQRCRGVGRWTRRVAGWRAAEGETPGWRLEMRTRSAPGRMVNRRRAGRSTASPSMPACTGPTATTSRRGAVQARPG